jgi:hypothetical protein
LTTFIVKNDARFSVEFAESTKAIKAGRTCHDGARERAMPAPLSTALDNYSSRGVLFIP